jgi:hypothetical protein
MSQLTPQSVYFFKVDAVVWSSTNDIIGFFALFYRLALLIKILISSAKFYEDGIDRFGMVKHYSAIEF